VPAAAVVAVGNGGGAFSRLVLLIINDLSAPQLILGYMGLDHADRFEASHVVDAYVSVAVACC